MIKAKTKAEKALVGTLKDRISMGLQTAMKGGDGNEATLRDARVKALRFYRRQQPERFNDNSSSFVSSDVFDAVETRKATLLETFTGNVKPVKFAPNDPQFADLMEQATTRVDQVVMNEQDGYMLMQGAIHDGLMARVGIVQAFWETEVSHIPFAYSGITDDAATAILSEKQADVIDWDTTPNDDGTVDLAVTLRVDKSGVRLELVPAEEFGINSDAKDLKSATFTYRKRNVPLSALKGMGVSQADIDDIIADENFMTLTTDPASEYEKAVRVDDVGLYNEDDSAQLKRLIMVNEVYLTIDTDAGKQVYQALWAAERLLDYKQVQRHPFHVFLPHMVPHRFWGEDFAGTVSESQKVSTSLTRFALDHGMSAAVPRWLVREGSLTNPREMENPVMGGLVNVQGDTADSVRPMPYPNLNPALFKLLEQVQQDKQMLTGSSDLSGSMLKDVLSNQNSADLVSQMATMGQTRTKMMARNFAFFLKGLYEHVYDLLVENQKQQTAMQMGENWVFVDPSKWPIERMAHVEFHIGYGERDKEAAQLMQFDQYVSAQPGLGRMYSETQRFNVLSDVMRLTGRYNVPRYLADPATLPPPQPSQAEQMAAQLQEREMAVKEQNANTAAMAANAHAQNSIMSTSAKAQTNQGNQALKEQQQELKVAQFQHQATIDAAEVSLQQRAHQIQAVAKPVNTQPQR